ncbi:NAD-dependent epimerase/dehydratase family protein [Thaumasiovibrio subtropicus]|nr:NAD-dependent epimerase/dehydratase family protein [Thaumasiovibrio subtropicus]
MKILLSGSHGYVGNHVYELLRQRQHNVYILQRGKAHPVLHGRVQQLDDGDAFGTYDVVINCARPHWSEYDPETIAEIERQLLADLDKFAKRDAVKIHTSGVWLFGHATQQEMNQFKMAPFECVSHDKRTVLDALNQGWNVVFCPSLIYGGKRCQLKRIVDDLDSQQMSVLLPSTGFNQYVHVDDVADFFLALIAAGVHSQPHAIAEPIGYSPLAFAKLLTHHGWIKQIQTYSQSTFIDKFGDDALDIEKLNVCLPISPLFRPKYAVADYVEETLQVSQLAFAGGR